MFKLALIAANLALVLGAAWNHDDQEAWAKDAPACAGKRQSPIDLKSDSPLAEGTLKLDGKYDEPLEMTFENNGHAIQSNLKSEPRPSLDFNGETYNFQQVHFHWGPKADEGSEHTVDGKYSALEGHQVHYNAKYGDFGSAVDKPDGLLVLGTLYDEVDGDNPALEPFISNLDAVKCPKSEVQHKVTLNSIQPKDKTFYNYLGSLTTPPCLETVTWVVFKEKLTVGKRQMDKLRAITQDKDCSTPLTLNYRAVQPLNGRQPVVIKA